MIDDELENISTGDIDKFIEERLKKVSINRRNMILSCLKIAGAAILGKIIISDIRGLFAEVEWNEERKNVRSKSNTSKAKSTVIKVINPKSVDSSGNGNDGIVMDMVSKAIKELTGEKDLGKAWGKIAKRGQRVGIKVNCIAGKGMSSQIPVIMAIVEGLKKASIPERDIIIWDRTSHELERAGYQINENTDTLRCFGTDKVGYWNKEQNINGTRFRLSKILTDEIDVLINVPVMKNHGTAGVTLSMKNHYGSHDNPNEHHKNHCDPHIANINSHEIIKNKTKLIVLDSLRAQYEGGPSNKPKWQWTPGMILVSYDPVAIDRVGSEIIESKRIELGVNSLGNSHRHIETAASMGLGVGDLENINIKVIQN